MSDHEIMISAGLYEKNLVTGEKGYNLAAIMLFGKDEVIRSCVSGYVTDAIWNTSLRKWTSKQKRRWLLWSKLSW